MVHFRAVRGAHVTQPQPAAMEIPAAVWLHRIQMRQAPQGPAVKVLGARRGSVPTRSCTTGRGADPRSGPSESRRCRMPPHTLRACAAGAAARRRPAESVPR